MSRADRGVRRAIRQLAPGETVVASVLGSEADGRRARIVLVTDRRVLAGGMRGDPDETFPLDTATCTYHHAGGLLTLSAGGREIMIRHVDGHEGRALVELLASRASHHRARPGIPDRPEPSEERAPLTEPRPAAPGVRASGSGQGLVPRVQVSRG